MHNNNHLKKTESFRFRRWSRAGYAIFRSLSCCVTIGSVCVSICDMSFRKSSPISLKATSKKSPNKDTEEEDSEKIEDIISLIQLELLVNSTLVKPVAAAAILSSNTKLSIYKPAVGISQTYTNRFFYI